MLMKYEKIITSFPKPLNMNLLFMLKNTYFFKYEIPTPL